MSASGTPLPARRTVAQRFRGFLPVVVDVETGGFNPETDALLEVAAVLLDTDGEGRWHPVETHSCHDDCPEGTRKYNPGGSYGRECWPE